MSEITMQSVTSSNIGAVGYDEDEKILRVQFAKNGHVYDYKGVPKRIYDDLMSAESIGAFFAANIRNDFPYTKV